MLLDVWGVGLAMGLGVESTDGYQLWQVLAAAAVTGAICTPFGFVWGAAMAMGKISSHEQRIAELEQLVRALT